MRKRSSELATALAVALVASIGSASGVLASNVRNAIVPDSGIGAIHLGESRHDVERALGPGHSTSKCGCFRRYTSGKLSLTVGYSRTKHVSQITTASRAATLDGRRLTDGYESFRHRLKGWQALQCGSVKILEHETKRGSRVRSTTLEWGPHLLSAQVSDSAPGGCGVGSPGNGTGP